MTDQLLNRQDVPVENKWNVGLLYASDVAWETDFGAAAGLPERIAAYQGRLSESAKVLAEAISTWFDANRTMEKLYVYAHLRNDEDLGNSEYQVMLDRARSAYIAMSTAGAYLSPELLAIDDEVIQSWMETPELVPYRFWLVNELRSKPHTLTPREERIMSMAAEPLGSISKVYSVLKNVDLAARLPQVTDSEGKAQQLSHAAFIKMQESRDRGLRRAAFAGYYGEYKGNRNTNAAALDGAVKTHIFQARARNFPSALHAALFPDNVDTSVYESLIEAVHDALPAFYRYVALRQRLLGYDKLHLYDSYVPVIPSVDLSFTWDEAVETVIAALQPLGDDYVGIMRDGLEKGWVDRYENVGKRSGAYSSGCYDSMPYILMNFTGTLDSMFTLAHELGHSMHSYMSNRAQPYHLADYRILVAEVASTTNEALLNDYLLKQTSDPAVRAYLIDRYLDSFRGTLYRQTMFAEFEKLIHKQVEAGQPLTADSLDETYLGLVKLYFGDTMAFDEEDLPIAWEWSRVDHFFYNFYVYKYATGMSSAIAIGAAILNDGDQALKSYRSFLNGGGSDYPLELLKGAGVDLTTPGPVRSALAEFERLLGDLEAQVS